MCTRILKYELSPQSPEVIQNNKDAAAGGTPEEAEAGTPRDPEPSAYKFCHKYARNLWRSQWCRDFSDQLRSMLGRFAGYGENVMTNKNVKQILYDMFERHFWFKRYGLKGQGLNPNTGKQFETEAIARDVCRKVTTCPLDLAVNIPLSMKNQNPDSWFALQNSDKVRQEISALGWETGFGRKAVPTNMNTTEALARGLKKINQMPKLVLNVETGLKNFDNEAEENAKQNDDFLEVADIEGEDEGEGGGEGGGEGEGDDGMGDEEGGRGEKGSEVEHAAFLEATARTRTRKRIRGGKGGGASMGGGVGGAIKA